MARPQVADEETASNMEGSYTSGCCMAIATQQPDVWYRHIPAYATCDVQLIKVAPEDGLI